MATHHNLQHLCKTHNHSQKFLAIEFGLGQSTYHRYHSGKRKMPDWLIQKAAALYKVTPEALKGEPPISIGHHTLSQTEKELYERLLFEKDEIISTCKALIAEKDRVIALQNLQLKNSTKPVKQLNRKKNSRDRGKADRRAREGKKGNKKPV